MIQPIIERRTNYNAQVLLRIVDPNTELVLKEFAASLLVSIGSVVQEPYVRDEIEYELDQSFNDAIQREPWFQEFRGNAFGYDLTGYETKLADVVSIAHVYERNRLKNA